MNDYTICIMLELEQFDGGDWSIEEIMPICAYVTTTAIYRE